LVIADKDSEFINEWFNMLIFFMTNTYQTTYNKMVECMVDGEKWTNSEDRYLAVMDALKVVIGCREKEIAK